MNFSTLYLEDGAARRAGVLGLPTSVSVKLNEDHLLANQFNLDNLSLSHSGQRILGCVSDLCCQTHLSSWQSEPKLTSFLLFSAFESCLLWLGDVVQR